MKTDREPVATLLPLALSAMWQAQRLMAINPTLAQDHLSDAIRKVSLAVDHLREPA